MITLKIITKQMVFRSFLLFSICLVVPALITQPTNASQVEVTVNLANMPRSTVFSLNTVAALSRNNDAKAINALVYLAADPRDPARISAVKQVFDEQLKATQGGIQSSGSPSLLNFVSSSADILLKRYKVPVDSKQILDLGKTIIDLTDLNSRLSRPGIQPNIWNSNLDWGSAGAALELNYKKLLSSPSAVRLVNDFLQSRGYGFDVNSLSLSPDAKNNLNLQAGADDSRQSKMMTIKLSEGQDKLAVAIDELRNRTESILGQTAAGTAPKVDTQSIEGINQMAGDIRAMTAMVSYIFKNIDPMAAKNIGIIGAASADLYSSTAKFLLSEGSLGKIGASALTFNYVAIAITVIQQVQAADAHQKEMAALFQGLHQLGLQLERIEQKIDVLTQQVTRITELMEAHFQQIHQDQGALQEALEHSRTELARVQNGLFLSLQNVREIEIDNLRYFCFSKQNGNMLSNSDFWDCQAKLGNEANAMSKAPYVNGSVPGKFGDHSILRQLVSATESSDSAGAVFSGLDLNYLSKVAQHFKSKENPVATGVPNESSTLKIADIYLKVTLANVSKFKIFNDSHAQILGKLQAIKQFLQQTVGSLSFNDSLVGAYSKKAGEIAELKNQVVSQLVNRANTATLDNSSFVPCRPELGGDRLPDYWYSDSRTQLPIIAGQYRSEVRGLERVMVDLDLGHIVHCYKVKPIFNPTDGDASVLTVTPEFELIRAIKLTKRGADHLTNSKDSQFVILERNTVASRWADGSKLEVARELVNDPGWKFFQLSQKWFGDLVNRYPSTRFQNLVSEEAAKSALISIVQNYVSDSIFNFAIEKTSLQSLNEIVPAKKEAFIYLPGLKDVQIGDNGPVDVPARFTQLSAELIDIYAALNAFSEIQSRTGALSNLCVTKTAAIHPNLVLAGIFGQQTQSIGSAARNDFGALTSEQVVQSVRQALTNTEPFGDSKLASAPACWNQDVQYQDVTRAIELMNSMKRINDSLKAN